jgi:hypothetical protein
LSEDGISSIQFILKYPQVRRLSDPAIATKRLSRADRRFCTHGANYLTKIIYQGPYGLEIVKQIRSPLLKASRRDSECFRARQRFKFGLDIFRFQPLKHEETDHRSLFHLIPQRRRICLKFSATLSGQIAEGQLL